MRSFIFGLGIGIGLGVLFAPSSGEQMRRNLSERADELANNARETYEEGRARVRGTVSAMRSTAEHVGEAARETVRDMKRTAGAQGGRPTGTGGTES